MKHLIYFLLFSTAVFSQNYQYSLEEAKIKLPEMPSGLVASQITDTSADLNWIAPAARLSISSYGIYSANNLLAKSQGSGTNYKLSGLIPDTAYTLTVRAVDDQGIISSDSNSQTFRTKKTFVETILSPPVALMVSQVTDNSAFLTWSAPEDNSLITEYGIYSKNILLGKAVGTSLSYKLGGLTPETLYTLSVRSIDESGKTSVDSEMQTFTTKKIDSQPILLAPSTLLVSQVTDNSALLTWVAPTDNSTITDYGIYNNNVFLAKSVGTSTSYKVTGFTPETSYSLTVRSMDKTGNMSVDSNVQKFTTSKVPAPSSLIANQITENSVFLNWIAPAGATSVTDYVIYNNNVFVAKSIGTATTYKITGLTPETAYTLTVRSLDKAGNMSLDSNLQTFTTSKKVVASGVNNQLEEIEYFKAYLLPIAQKATLQQALDKYGSVRLQKGDYSGVPIVMRSNQRLYGHPSLTQVSDITIAAGSKNVHLEDLFLNYSSITFQAGGVISGCNIKTIKYGTMRGTNVMHESNSIINFRGTINFDCSQSGYIRNNKIIKNQSGSLSNLLVMKGNAITPSYGNVHLHTNFLTPHGDSAILEGLESVTFVGIDAEGWNFAGKGTKAMFYARNMGDVKITDLSGGNSYGAWQTPSYDIEANNFLLMNRDLIESGTVPTMSNKTNFLSYYNQLDNYTRFGGGTPGFDLKAQHFDKNYNKNSDVKLNNIVQTSTISNQSPIINAILGTKHTPWARPEWEILPDPLGANWKADRIGKVDSRAYIQNLIDTNEIAELPEGVFYISSTLMMPTKDFKHGIVGQGTGKTVIVGLRDDFPLISTTASQDGSFILSNLTLQGGSVGIYTSLNYGALKIAWQNIKFVVFRNQTYGIHLDKNGGWDNTFLDNVGFVECNIGFYQEPAIGSDKSELNSTYVDKTMFYKNQFIKCTTAISMIATRADNVNAWVDCKFDNNTISFNIENQKFPIVANCDFTNHRGANIIKGAALSMYNCNFYNNSVTDATFKSAGGFFEGCNLMDDVKMYADYYVDTRSYIMNSTVKGNVIKAGSSIFQSVLVNSILLSNPSLSKMLVNIKDRVPTVLINVASTPYPQLLVKQNK